jgi:hypothetical protein
MPLGNASKTLLLKMGSLPDVRLPGRSYDDLTTNFEVRQP